MAQSQPYDEGEESNPYEPSSLLMDLSQQPENAKCYHYDAAQKTWSTSTKRVRISSKPCGEGGMRLVVRLDVLAPDDSTVTERCVAKMFKSQSATAKEYLNEAITQVTCQLWAEQFNSLPVPSPVSFLPVTVMELLDRPDKDLINVEPLMEGRFFKHNDNAGRVKSDRHTPQAFSHFSWEASNHSLLVCDIQGVKGPEGDLFTDPQIHSIDGVENGNVSDGSGFGPGNFGYQGIVKFAETHKCNRLCRQLGLPPIATQDQQLKQPSAWSTAHCRPLPSGPGCAGTCSRLSASRLTTTETDKLRADQLDYPDLQAPKQATAPEPEPEPTPEYCSAQEMRQHTARRQQEVLAGLHREAPHLLSQPEALDPQWLRFSAQELAPTRPQARGLPEAPSELRRRPSYELLSQVCFKPEEAPMCYPAPPRSPRPALHVINTERGWAPEFESPRSCRGFAREEFLTPSMVMSPAGIRLCEELEFSPRGMKLGRRGSHPLIPGPEIPLW